MNPKTLLFNAAFLPQFLSAGAGAGRSDFKPGLEGIGWHSHEMIFGFAAAIIAGFLLTAVENWTGRPTARGPLLAVLVGKSDPSGDNRHHRRDRGKALASSSTLNRLELTHGSATAESRYKKIVADPEGMEDLLVDLFR